MERRLAAILAADVVGYTALMGADESGTLRRLTDLRREFLEPLIDEHRGRTVKLMGDGFLVEFASVVDAVSCAIDWQSAAAEAGLPFRIGINLGDVIVEGEDIHGDGVNIAARLEAQAETGGICLSGDAYRQARGKVGVLFEDLGEQELKNVSEPVRVYRIVTAEAAPPKDAPPLPDKPSIAVLPFTNMSGDPEQEYFSDGISEDIITALSKISKIFVVARNSTFTYKGRAIDVKQVGREQGVQFVLEGSVRRSGDRLRITAQLIDALTGHHLWAQRYDRVVQDVFDLQDEITREVTAALQVELTEGEHARLWSSGTKNHEAWEIVLQLQEPIISHRKDDVHRARQLAKKAIALDESYAAAWNFLGWSYYEDAFNGWTDNPENSLELALQAAERSRSIDDMNPHNYALLAFIHLSLRKYEEAAALGEKALLLGPSDSFVAGCVANVALFCNEPRLVADLVKKAMRLCPIHPPWYPGDLGWAYMLMNRQEEAVATVQEAVKIDPDFIFSYMVLAIAGAELGRAEEASAAVANMLRIDPTYTVRTFAQSQPFRDAEVLQRHLDGLRKAGLPE